MRKLAELFEKAIVRIAQASAPVDQATPRELGSLNLGEKDYAAPSGEKGFLDLWREDQHKSGPPI